MAWRGLVSMTGSSAVAATHRVAMEPMRAFPPLGGLVTDVSWTFAARRRLRKFKPRPPDAPDGTWRMAQEDIERVQEFRKCIECYLCQDVCHVIREHKPAKEFIGPRFFVYAAALEMHPLDVEDRAAQLREAHGIGYCNITKCCTHVRPEDIQITDHPTTPRKKSA